MFNYWVFYPTQLHGGAGYIAIRSQVVQFAHTELVIIFVDFLVNCMHALIDLCIVLACIINYVALLYRYSYMREVFGWVFFVLC